MIRTYSELIRLKTFEERYDYLKLSGTIGSTTFGFDRYINQIFYTSNQWRQIRDYVIVRDNGCDLGIQGLEIYDGIRVHHMNPVLIEDFENGNCDILNPDFLISSSLNTHNRIHFEKKSKYFSMVSQERKKGDTTPWIVY